MARFGMIPVAALCGAAAACLYLASVLGSPGAMILVYLTQLPLFIAGLWLGTSAAVVACLTATLVLLAASDLFGTLLFAGLYAAPVIFLVRQALLARRRSDGATDWYPPGRLTAWLAGFGLAGCAAVVLVLGGQQGVEAEVRQVLGRIFTDFAAHSSADRARMTSALALIMPGVVAASWMMMVAMNGTLAQGVLARFGANWRPSPDLAALGLPLWLPIGFAVAVAAGAMGGTARFLGINAIVALVVPFCLAGLAVLHLAARRLARPQVPLVLFYVLATFLGWPLLFAALLGLVDSCLGLRRRLAATNSVGGKIDG